MRAGQAGPAGLARMGMHGAHGTHAHTRSPASLQPVDSEDEEKRAADVAEHEVETVAEASVAQHVEPQNHGAHAHRLRLLQRLLQ
jgi:hypothetical protein